MYVPQGGLFYMKFLRSYFHPIKGMLGALHCGAF